MNSVWHWHLRRVQGNALIAAIVLAAVSTLPVLAGLDRIQYQSQLASSISQYQNLHLATRQALYEAALAANVESDSLPFLPSHLTGHAWPDFTEGAQYSYLVEKLSPLSIPSSMSYFILTAHAGDTHGNQLFLRALYKRLGEEGTILKTWSPY